MSKIFEALQNAQQESLQNARREPGQPEKSENVPTATTAATLLPAVAELDMENEMIGLFQSLETLLTGLDGKVLQFIGARAGEGTSTVVREFARVAAKKLGKSVFLLDAGLHRPKQCIFFHISPESGWEEVAETDCSFGRTRKRGEIDVEMCADPPPPSIAALNFYSSQISDFWESLKQKYDLILVDSAPATVSPDGIEISRRVDGVVLVVEAEKTRWQVVDKLKEKIEYCGGNILGVVFNKRRFYIPESVYKLL